MPFGAFGENLSIEGLTEHDVHVGDTWLIGGEAEVQVSQPRQPCWKLARRWRRPRLAIDMRNAGRTGWYFRGVAVGFVTPGDMMTLVDRPNANWSVARANQVMYANPPDTALARELAGAPFLSANWRRTLARRAEGGEVGDASERLFGANTP